MYIGIGKAYKVALTLKVGGVPVPKGKGTPLVDFYHACNSKVMTTYPLERKGMKFEFVSWDK